MAQLRRVNGSLLGASLVTVWRYGSEIQHGAMTVAGTKLPSSDRVSGSTNDRYRERSGRDRVKLPTAANDALPPSGSSVILAGDEPRFAYWGRALETKND